MINRGLFVVLLALTSSSGWAGILDCAELKATIESKLKANKVRQYSLEIVSANQDVGAEVGRIVGSCNNGRQKIVYARSAKPLSAGAASVQALPVAAPISRVDARGFIDVWTLRMDALAVSDLRQRKRFEQHRAAFNARWLPVLKGAMQLGDPVAEVVLRLCETTPLLDRTGIAADCSENADDKAFARQRLETIGFEPALHKYTPTAQADDWQARQATCGQGNPATHSECGYRADIARYERILSVMRSGYLSVAESWNTCQMGGETPDLDKLAEECQRLMNLMMAVSAGVDRFYTAGPIDGALEGLSHLSLQRPILRGAVGTPRKEWPFDKRGIVTRNDWRTFSDADFQQRFYAELDKTIQQIEAKLANDLRKEPRWAVFLIERLAGRLYDAMDTVNPNRPGPADIASFEANSPRSQAIRKEQEIERLKTVSYPDLIESLHASRNPNLHYVWKDFPLNLQELGRRPADVAALVSAYYAEKNDEVFRFNIIMILNHKRTQPFSAEETKLITQCFVDALSDSSSMVRAEASWQASMFGEQINNPAVKQLILKGRQEEQEALLKWRN